MPSAVAPLTTVGMQKGPTGLDIGA